MGKFPHSESKISCYQGVNHVSIALEACRVRPISRYSCAQQLQKLETNGSETETKCKFQCLKGKQTDACQRDFIASAYMLFVFFSSIFHYCKGNDFI